MDLFCLHLQSSENLSKRMDDASETSNLNKFPMTSTAIALRQEVEGETETSAAPMASQSGLGPPGDEEADAKSNRHSRQNDVVNDLKSWQVIH